MAMAAGSWALMLTRTLLMILAIFNLQKKCVTVSV